MIEIKDPTGKDRGREMKRSIDLPENKIAELCQRWQINEFALFGSVGFVAKRFSAQQRWSMDWHDHIAIESEVLAEKLVVKDTRLAVEFVFTP